MRMMGLIALVGVLASGTYFVLGCRENTNGGVSMNQDDQQKPLEDIVEDITIDPKENQKIIIVLLA